MPRRLPCSCRSRTALVAGLAAALLAGCAGADEAGTEPSGGSPSVSTTSAPASTPESTSASPTESRARGAEFTVSVRDGKVRPKTLREKVAEGTRVRLVITSDVDDEVHVHGYELERELPAGQSVTIAFTADQTGLFEVETHETGLQLLQLEVR